MMTHEEKQAFLGMEKDIHDLIKSQSLHGSKLDEIIKCLKGDDLGNKGLVERIIKSETDILELKNARAIDKAYARIVIWLLAAITGSVIAGAISIIF
jgi:hypothetical protein